MNKQKPDRFPVLWAVYVIILLLPFFLFLWPYPFLSLSNYGFDYWNHHIQDQAELAFALHTGTFPLYISGYFHGQTAFVLSEGQLFHPFFYFITHFPGYWQGHAADLSMLFHLLGLAGAHLALFALLRRLKFGVWLSLFLSLVTVYNLRLLLLSWFGSPLEAWSGHLLLCAAIGCYYLKPTPVKGPLLIMAATYWLVTCGHPVWTYYGLITAGLFTMLFPFYVPVVSGANNGVVFQPRVKFWGKTALWSTAGLLLAGGYVVPYYFDFVVKNSGIADQSYAWACSLPEPAGELLNNFFLPLRTGYAMFAGTALYLAAVLTPMLVLWRKKIPGIIWVVLALTLFIFLYMLGPATPVHSLIWKYFPLNHLIRGASRPAFALPMLFLLVLGWLFRSSGLSQPGRKEVPASSTVLGITAAILLVLYVFFAPESVTTDLASHARLNLARLPGWPEHLIFLSGVLSLLLLALYGKVQSSRRQVIMILLCAMTVGHLVVLFRFNPLYYTPLAVKERSPALEQMAAEKKTTLNMHMDHFYLNPGRGNKVVMEQLRNYFIEPEIGKIYRKYIIAGDRTEAYRILNQGRKPDEVVIDSDKRLRPWKQRPLTADDPPDRVRLEYGSYNRMVFTAVSGAPAFFVFAPAYTGHWRARVNGRRAPVFHANGASHAVRVPAGVNIIEFRYWSRPAATGMALACLTLAAIGCWLGAARERKTSGFLVAAVFVLAAASVYTLWYFSLYTGDNLGTAYTWVSPLPGAPQNIAYGKPTAMSSYKKGDLCFPFRYSSRHAVDGDSGHQMTSSSHTDLEENPWWQVDLQATAQIQSIRVYLTPPYGILPFNQRPLHLLYSTDGKDWQSVPMSGNGDHIGIRFQRPVPLRYARIQASGKCVLSLMEVEIFAWPGTEDH